ncbi:aldehyde dehydrogenase family protein [Glutamicibacter sp.]|uniref:aldehyde dehydrogenase family protein n=1 Tax=Glutamicibacter sp. TaxID=1931995 RepID=UPI003D6B3D3B
MQDLLTSLENLYIGGRWIRSSGQNPPHQVLNPADGSVLATVCVATTDDVDNAVRSARAAFDGGQWSELPIRERGQKLARIAEIVLEHREELARIESLDAGKTLREARLDVDDAVSAFRYFANAADLDSGRMVDAGDPKIISRIGYVPVGVCALIAAWNYPLQTISWKLAPALAAGNTVVIKPSEVTPLSTMKLVELMEQAELPAGTVNLLLGPGSRVGATMTSHPEVDLISFTGGLEAGSKVMAAASADIKKVALELGGKNPNIIFDDTDFETVVDNALSGAFVHSGQVCSAGSRLIVHEGIYDRFVAELARRAELIRLGNGFDPSAECGPLATAEHREAVEGHIERAIAEGARLVAGGHRPPEPELADGYFLRPTVFADCERTMGIVREEVFGPVVTVERFSTEQEAVFLANDTEYGLAGAVWTNDASRAQRVAQSLRHGTVWINDYHPYLPQAEWGGFGKSGFGRENGIQGLNEYRETRHIYQNIQPAPARWFQAEGA